VFLFKIIYRKFGLVRTPTEVKYGIVDLEEGFVVPQHGLPDMEEGFAVPQHGLPDLREGFSVS